MTNVIELAKQAELDKELFITNKCQERLKRFANLVRNAALDEAAEYLEGVHQSRLVKFAEAIRNIKEPTP